MAIAAPRVKLLRQLARAKDDYLSGAFDIGWDDGAATIFIVFGQPSHAVFESAGTRLEGEPAVEALIRELPAQFGVGEWRRVMSPRETLSLTIDDITEPLALLAGEPDDAPFDDASLSWLGGLDDSPDLGFDVDGFPLLPDGPALWEPAAAAGIELSRRIAELGSALIVLTGPRLRAAGVVRDGDLIDAVWVDSDDHARGETAAMALLGAREGSLAGVALDPDVAEAVPLLWRLPWGQTIDTLWVDPAGVLAALRADAAGGAVLVEGAERGVGLFGEGALICAYTSESREPATTADILLDLLAHSGTSMRVLRRSGAQRPPAPKPAAATPAADPPPAADGPEAEPDAAASWMDWDEARDELARIAVHWLGENDAAPVVRLVMGTRPAIDSFVTTIDAIRTLTVPGHEAGTVQSMAREMHLHAAERLCGA